jgi:hypothetical protein
VVLEFRPTVTGVAVGVVVLLELAEPGRKLAEEKPSTVMVLADTAVTLPVAKLKPAPRPAGRVPDVGVVRRGKVPGGRFPRPPKPCVHDPVELGCPIVTDVATRVPLLDEPLTVTQSPTATAEAGSVTVWLKRVELVQLTVTCPCCWFWTSIDCPVMAATDPKAPGNDPPLPGLAPAAEFPDEPALDVGVVALLLELVLAWLDPPQAAAARVKARAPAASATPGGRRNRRFMTAVVLLG